MPPRGTEPDSRPLQNSISIVIPVLNEAEAIPSTLRKLAGARAAGHEVIVVDGGSGDGTPDVARDHADRVLHSEPGRARQMNTGAAHATREVILFLHADTRLPEGGLQQVVRACETAGWGRFDVALSGSHPFLRVIERMISWRSRWSGIATGDQAMFVRRDLFERVGGFPDMPLMEDLALSRTLRKQERPQCLRARVVTSSRRWETNGIIRTVLLMWTLRAAFYLGVSPARLAAFYRAAR